MSLVAELVAGYTRRGWTLATAESLTAGLVSAGIADVGGASAVLRGGAVTYATACKATVLGVDAQLLERRGAVDPDVARGMALGARGVFGADVAVATTGVAGPSRQDGAAVGTVYVAVAYVGESSDDPVRCRVREFHFPGDRAAVRAASADAAWQLCLDALAGMPSTPHDVVGPCR